MFKRSMKILVLFLSLTIITACGEPDPSFSLLSDNDVFLQNSNEINTKIDILWVIDNSGSMETSQDALVANFEEFIDGFRDRGFDFQMAVTTTDAYRDLYLNGELSRFKDGTNLTSHTGEYIVTPQTPNFESTFLINVLQGIAGHGDERAFSSFTTALDNPLNQGFVRPDSFLAVIIVSDEDDLSHDNINYVGDINDPSITPIQNYVDYLDNLTNSTEAFKRYSVSALAILDEDCRQQLTTDWPGRRIGERYLQLVEATGGEKGSLCENFAVILDFISEGIIQLATQFYLNRIPKPETIQVIINNQAVAPVADPANPKDGWLYNADNNSVMFYGSAIPAQGANINIVYDPVAVGQ
ncbi:MAG: hypothetical protein H6625_08235 [Bdellovibrionaceae bacterium]|nr:hypothetical protein [Pseudobdellovibrionaceae bacterium]